MATLPTASTLVRTLIYIVIGGACLVLAGWWLGLPVLTAVRPGFITMKANTAAGFLLLGTAALLIVARGPNTRRIARLLAVLALLVASLTLIEYLAPVNFGIDELLVRDPEHSTLFPPGRLAPITAVNFVLLAVAIILCSGRRRAAFSKGHFLILISMLCAFQGLIPYLIGDQYVFGPSFASQMAIITAVLFIALCSALLLMHRHHGFMRIIRADTLGGFMARRTLAVAIVVPPVLHWLGLQGQRHHILDADFAALLGVEGNTILFMAVIWYTASLLHLNDRKRQRSHAALEAAQRQLTKSWKREKAARAAAESACQEAQRASRLKEEFLANMSHELRTPAHVIQGFSELLAERIHDQDLELRTAVEAIQRNAQIQTKLIGDLLDVSRIVSGGLQLAREPINLKSLIDTAVSTVQLALSAKGISLEVSVEAGPGLLVGDPLRLQQVLWNLLANAVKFTPANGTILVKVTGSDQAVEITVSDNGQGIAPEFLAFVFDRFSQQDSSTTKPHGGLGLGLAIARQLVELHGGSISVASEGVGRGATFSVRLPAQQARHRQLTVATAPARSASETAGPAPQLLCGLNILVVDDAPDVRLLVTAVLRRHGARVFEASSAAEAFASLSTMRPDVLISDIGMPGEDGYQFMRRLRAMEAKFGGHIPAAALSAYTLEEAHRLSFDAGFEVHLDKPVSAATLVQNVINLAARRAVH